MRLGIVGSSRKAHEGRLPLHPAHLGQLPEVLRAALVLEEGYGEALGWPDERLRPWVGAMGPREALLAECEACLLLKPEVEDLAQLRPGGLLWGWAHAVQQPLWTAAARRQGLTVVALESMHLWEAGRPVAHVLASNNELAGWASVHHALACHAQKGAPPPRRTVLLGAGATAQGALRALESLGLGPVRVLRRRALPLPGGHEQWAWPEGEVGGLWLLDPEGRRRPASAMWAQAELLVLALKQDPLRPWTFLEEEDLGQLAPEALLVDVSCDQKMGFGFARPTSLAEPLRRVGPCWYYGVDHSPTWRWEEATERISRDLLPWMGPFLAGPEAWGDCPTLAKAVVLWRGEAADPELAAFQGLPLVTPPWAPEAQGGVASAGG